MLVLRRRIGQQIVIDGKITVTVHRIEGGRVSLSFDAPSDVRIMRSELSPEESPAASVAAGEPSSERQHQTFAVYDAQQSTN